MKNNPTFKEILKNRNAEGRIYLCDIRRLLHWKITFQQAQEIRETLEEYTRA